MLQTRYHLRWILLSGMLVSIAKVNDCAQAIDSALKLAETVLKAAAAVSSATAVEYLTQRIQSIQWGNAAAGITTPTVAAAIVKGSTDLSVAMGTSTIASAATSAAGSGAGVGAGVGLGTVAATAFASVFAEPLVELFQRWLASGKSEARQAEKQLRLAMKEAGTALRNAEYAAAHPEKYTPQELIHLADKAEQTHIKSVELSLAARNSTYASRVMPVPVQKPIEPVVDAAVAAERRLNRRISVLEEKFLRKAAHFEYKAQRHPKSAAMYRGLAEEQRRMAAVCADQEVARTMSLCDIVAASKAPAQPVAVPEPEVIPSIESDLAPKLLTEVAVYQQMSPAEKENAVTESSKKATSEEARWLDMSDRLTENIKGCITNQSIIPTITTALVEIERCQMMASIARANALSLEPTQEITEEAKWLEMATRLTAKAKEYAGQKLEASLLAEAERYEGMAEAAQTARWLEEPVALTAEEASNLADNDKFPVRIDDQDWHHIFVDPGHFPGGPPDDDMKEKIKKAIIALIEKYNDGSGKKFIAEKLYEIIENLEGLGPDIWKIKGIVVNGFIRLSTAYIKK